MPAASPDLSQNPFALLSLIAAPAVLTNAASVLVMSTSNRLARVDDQARELAKRLEATHDLPYFVLWASLANFLQTSESPCLPHFPVLRSKQSWSTDARSGLIRLAAATNPTQGAQTHEVKHLPHCALSSSFALSAAS